MAVTESLQEDVVATSSKERPGAIVFHKPHNDHESVLGSSSSGEDAYETQLGSVAKLMHQLGHLGSELCRITQNGKKAVKGPRRRKSGQDHATREAPSASLHDDVKSAHTVWSAGWWSPRNVPAADNFGHNLRYAEEDHSWRRSGALGFFDEKEWLPPPVPVMEGRRTSDASSGSNSQLGLPPPLPVLDNKATSEISSTRIAQLDSVARPGVVAQPMPSTHATPHAKPGELRCCSNTREAVNPMMCGSARRRTDQAQSNQEAATLHEYMEKHSLEERLSDMLGSVLQKRPTNPTEFMAGKLIEYSSKSTSVGSNSSSLGGTSASTGHKSQSGTIINRRGMPTEGNVLHERDTRGCTSMEPDYAPAESSGSELWLRQENRLDRHVAHTGSLSMDRLAGCSTLEPLTLPDQRQAELHHKSFAPAQRANGAKRSRNPSHLMGQRRASARQSSSSPEQIPDPPWAPAELAPNGSLVNSTQMLSNTGRLRSKHAASLDMEQPSNPAASSRPEPPWISLEKDNRATGLHRELQNELASQPKEVGAWRSRRRNSAAKQAAVKASGSGTKQYRLCRRSASARNSVCEGDNIGPTPSAGVHGNTLPSEAKKVTPHSYDSSVASDIGKSRTQAAPEPQLCPELSSDSELGACAPGKSLGQVSADARQGAGEPPIAPAQHGDHGDHTRGTVSNASHSNAELHQKSSPEPPWCPGLSSDSEVGASLNRTSGGQLSADARQSFSELPKAPEEHHDLRRCAGSNASYPNTGIRRGKESEETDPPPTFWNDHDTINGHSNQDRPSESVGKTGTFKKIFRRSYSDNSKVAAPKKKRRSSSKQRNSDNINHMATSMFNIGGDGPNLSSGTARHEEPEHDPPYLHADGRSSETPFAHLGVGRRDHPDTRMPSQRRQNCEDSDSEDRTKYFNEFAKGAASSAQQSERNQRGALSEASNPTWKRLERLKKDCHIVANMDDTDTSLTEVGPSRDIHMPNASDATYILNTDHSARRKSAELEHPNCHSSRHSEKRSSLPKGEDSESGEEADEVLEEGQIANSLFRRPSRAYWESAAFSDGGKESSPMTRDPEQAMPKEMPTIDTDLQASAEEDTRSPSLTPALSLADTLAYTPTPGPGNGRNSLESKDLSPFDPLACTPGPHCNMELTPTLTEEQVPTPTDNLTLPTDNLVDISALPRAEQISTVFEELGNRQKSRLLQDEMYVLATALNYEKDKKEFEEEYKALCESFEVDLGEGFDKDMLTELLDEEESVFGNWDGWFVAEGGMPAVLNALQGSNKCSWCIKITPPQEISHEEARTPEDDTVKHPRFAREETEDWSDGEEATPGGETLGRETTEDLSDDAEHEHPRSPEEETDNQSDDLGNENEESEEGEEDYEDGESEHQESYNNEQSNEEDQDEIGDDEPTYQEKDINGVDEKHKVRRSGQKSLTKISPIKI